MHDVIAVNAVEVQPWTGRVVALYQIYAQRQSSVCITQLTH